MSDRKTRLTVTVDPHLAAYAEQLVNAGKAPSVSAVFNDALTERVERDKRIRRRWKEAAERADPEKVDRMIAHVQARAAVLPGRSARTVERSPHRTSSMSMLPSWPWLAGIPRS